MDVKEAANFKEQLDIVLKDTEKFVNASQQLKGVSESLDSYVAAAGKLNERLQQVSLQFDALIKGQKEMSEKIDMILKSVSGNPR